MKTTFSRNFFVYVLILLLALLLISVSFQLLVKNYMKDHAMESLQNNCATIAHVAAAYGTDAHLFQREFLVNLSVASKVSGADTVICDAAGRLQLCSDSPFGCEHQGLAITSKAYLQAVQERDFVSSVGIVSGLYKEPRYVVSTAIRSSSTNEIIGIVIVSSPTSSTMSVLKKLSDIYLFVAVFVVLVAVVIMTVYARKNTHPLRDMAKTATAFGHGNLKVRANVPENSPQELQELALAFNNMAQSLEKSEYQRTEFVANVSHELKTPMTTIGGYVDGILDGTIPKEQQDYYLRIVSQETKRLSRLVRSMLDISRLQEQGGIPEEKMTRFDMCECAGQVLITMEQRINSKNLDVQVDFPEHPVITLAHRDYMTQVVYNLLDNAVKFCPEEGVLGLKIREGGSKVYVTVSNNGPTIPPEELPLLFDRFHKLDKSRRENRDGWGLGLYIVKTIVCSHGEDISVSSANGVTEFTFTLPLVN